MNYRLNRLLLVLPCLNLFACSLLLGQGVVVDVPTKPEVALSLSGKDAALATEIISGDLKHSGMILPARGDTSSPYAAAGSADGSGITGTLTNKRTGAAMFSQTFSGSTREAAHAFSDAITQALTGLPGIASSKIAFICSVSGSKELYLADIDGANARATTHDNTICASPSLSKDGSKLVYTSYKSGYADIYLIDIKSGARNRICFFPGINSGPSFSPDGSQIAMTLSKDGNPEIYTMPLSGTNPLRITRTRGSETSPSWSPTGDRLVYSSDDRGGPQLFISSSSGITEMDHLVTGNSYCTKPDWSPDGKWIAFTTRIGGQFQIGVFDVTLRTGRLITTGGGQDPAWTRDSRHLVMANDGHLYLLDTVTRQSTLIVMPLDGCGEPTVTR